MANDTDMGRVVPVSVTVAGSDGAVIATLDERFAILGRTGTAELTDPVRAGGAVSENATDTPRRRRRDVTIGAPVDMRPFAEVSGDHNPIHTDKAAALLAGLESPIVHGMWLSAAAQHAVTATDGQARPPARLIGWTARFLGMVRPGDEVDFRVERVGIDQGAEVLEVAARIGSDLVMSATARLAAPKTVYAFPGQGIQHKGMGMDVRARSKAARKVWDEADKFTRDTLGFSVLHVVRDNPTSIIASGVHYHHPDGVLFLTQFTQVAMATVAAAQVAEMREQGAFVEGAIACGHSVGEYTALACVSGVFELEALLEAVFHRGSKMHDIVPRDELGRSNYRLAAIRPSQIDLPDDEVTAFVAEIAERTGEFLEIVNFNLRGSQYAIAGTVRGLEELEAEVERRREISGGKRSFILVPGIDVPFHSRVLRVGVAEFRRSLERVMPRDKDPDVIIGRYIPNLVPRPFTLDRDFIQEIRDLVPAEPLDEILADYDTWRNERPRELARKVLIELLAWQFASPVRWIETQDLLFIEEAAGGLGVERFVEIGVKTAPTVAGLATNTLKLPEYAHSTVEVLNAERDAAVLFATDTDPEPEPRTRSLAVRSPTLPRRRRTRHAAPPPLRRRPRSVGCSAPRRHRIRRRRRHPGADRDVGQDAHRPDRGAGLHRVHHRRRVVAAQPAAGRPGLRAEPGRHRRRRRGRPGRAAGAGDQAGAHLQALRPSAFRRDQRSAAHGARAVGQAARRHRRAGQEDLGARRGLGQARHRRGRAGHPRGHQRPWRRHGPPARGCTGRRRRPSTRPSTPRWLRSPRAAALRWRCRRRAVAAAARPSTRPR